MTVSLKRVSMLLLALAMTLGLSGVLSLGITNKVNANGNSNPPGNNGTVKIGGADAVDDGQGNGNEPIISGCNVKVEWFGFDAIEKTAKINFTAQSPTTSGQITSPLGEQTHTFNTADSSKVYTMSFSGLPDAQGYHVKVTVQTPGSKGNDLKFKVFWVQNCTPPVVNDMYKLKFTKKWDGHKIDSSSYKVVFNFDLNGDPKTLSENEELTVKPGDVITNITESGFQLPIGCTYKASYPEDPYILFKNVITPVMNAMLVNRVSSGQTYYEILTVTNTVDCDGEDEPVTPVTPQGGTTPITPAGATTRAAQVTATPTGAVDAGAGVNLVASLAGLVSSAAVVATGIFLRKYGSISL